jgi:uncharacterized membrane protein YgaE (UPF0421/DUF939 family)
MDAAAATPLPASRPAWIEWLRSELAPTPGRGAETVRMVATVVLVVIISNALQVPELIISAYMVFLVSKENKVVTTLIGVMVILGVTIGIGVSLVAYRYTFDYPELRVPVMTAILFAGFYASRILAIGPLCLGIGFIFAATQSIAELMPNAEYLVRWLLWLWVAVCYPIALTVVVHRLHFPAFLGGSQPDNPAGNAPAQPKPKKPFLKPDAFTNPAHVHFALKVSLAAMTCYFIYTGLDWPGIHTAFITCCFISLESLGATLHKGGLRLAGCLVGGLLGFLSIMYLIPWMESITSLVLLVAAVSSIAAWVAAGSPRIAYAGLQIALAFFMCILQKLEPDTDFDGIRDRLVGIILGIAVTTLVYRYVWPEPEAQ